MNIEEKRELRLQISQLLADAGLNQGKIKEMVEEEIRHKVERAITQCLKNLNAQCSTGNYITERIEKLFHNTYVNQQAFNNVVREELKNRIINITLKDISVDE